MHPSARRLAVAVGVALGLAPAAARAQPRPPELVRLEVTRGPGSESCPDRDRVRALLAARLGRDAVSDAAARLAVLRFGRAGARIEVRLRIRGARGRATSRRLVSSATDCARLGEAASLVLALAIDPLVALRPPAAVAPATPIAGPPPAPPVAAPPAAAPPAAAPPVAAPPPPAPARATPPAPRTTWQVAALATLSTGFAPGAIAEGLGAGVALRVAPVRGRWTLPLEFALDAPGPLDDAARGARVWSLPARVGVAGCALFGARTVLSVCAAVAAGAAFAWGSGYAPDRTGVAFTVAAGARVGVESPLSNRWRFVASLDALALVVRPTVDVAGNAGGALWSAPPMAASVAIGAAWSNR